jgi:hypothetical protein
MARAVCGFRPGGTQAGRSLLTRQPFEPSDLDEVILGCAAPSPDETNIGRMVALRLGCGKKVPGWTVMRNCASACRPSIRPSPISSAAVPNWCWPVASTRCRGRRCSTPMRWCAGSPA